MMRCGRTVGLGWELRKYGNTPMLLPETAKFDSQKFRFLKFRPPDIADFRDWNHWCFALGGADQYLSAFFDCLDVTA
jgi:hypothetical protein